MHPSWAMVVRLPGQMIRICSSRHLPAALAIVVVAASVAVLNGEVVSLLAPRTMRVVLLLLLLLKPSLSTRELWLKGS